MSKFIKIILCSFVFVAGARAEYTTLSGAVDSVDLRNNAIVINSRSYIITDRTKIITNREKLKRGSVVDFTLNSDKMIKRLEIKPNLHIILPPINS
ncbi:hypothetical protein [methanotrophic endosymbiont of Bathymodiolus puteoserpentis (Logatchev)]|jgi:hypothetical protein|uniref:hypothetical protein n=1 Tax=methanotrophic endosymbiont of Bathymodiolus puteoserpentis (Logatchev) TaxID=343235 RepID=UPI00157B91E6|nr:hypothetical protein [methanotrophic endosymbiont of Bathymodiolus puteoserpentis (Logatchev)]